jgi:hypothetical protein
MLELGENQNLLQNKLILNDACMRTSVLGLQGENSITST